MESESDANSVLTELDKGLRSSKIGEQCEAIVRFPRLFEKYPFPILINSSFLKLGEFFRQGSNLVRLWILKVCQQSENHLDKILSTDEFVKRIFIVIHSNDPVARAITLRTLGAVARVIPEKVQIHHSIRRALDSHDAIEVAAAIFASSCFAAQSKTFSISMCAKIGSMIESLQTPVNMKLQLIPVLQHMHHDAKTAAMVKTLCMNLLPKYPAEKFVIAILDSLTKLSCNMLINVPDQVELCLKYLKDPRKKVRYQAFRSLMSLAKEGANLWPKSALSGLIASAKDYEEASEKSFVLIVILQLIECPIVCHVLINEEQMNTLELCSSCLVIENQTTASHSLAIITEILKFCHKEHITSPPIFMELINLHYESLIHTTLGKESFTKELKRFLTCGISLSEIDEEFSEDFVQMMGDLLSDDVVYPIKHTLLMCETLAALCSKFHLKRFEVVEQEIMEIDDESDITLPVKKSNPVTEKLGQILKKFDSILNRPGAPNEKLVEILSTVILQSIIGCFMPQMILDCFEKALKLTNCWTNYRIARTASRFGQHFLAAKIYSHISNYTSMDKYHFFLVSLTQMAKAECILNYGLEYDVICQDYKMSDPQLSKNHPQLISIIDRLEEAISLYCKALASLRASSTMSNPLTFQLEFVKLRAQFLQTLFGVVTAKNAQTIVPPPNIAASLAQNSRDYLQKFGHITNQLRKVVKSIKACDDSYAKLFKSSFDADPTTLEFLEATQYEIALFGNIIESVCYATPSDPPSASIDGKYPETKFLMYICNRMNLLAKHLPQEAQNAKTISNKHMEVIMNEIELITKSPICMPRFFFQVLQSTQITLSITPQPKSVGEAITVSSGSNLVYKVEGVIQHCGKCPSIYRSIDSVQLSLTSQLISPRSNDMKPGNDTVTLTQNVKPHRDFISGSFLVPLNNTQMGPLGAPIAIGGQWQVTLETFIIDEQGCVWSSGNKNTLLVRVPEDPSKNHGVNVAGGSNPIRRF